MVEKRILEENHNLLKEILLVLKLQNKEYLERVLGEVATTKERKIMWTLFDGKTNINEIAKKIGKEKRTVQYFIKDSEGAGLVEGNRGFPRKLIDFTPSNWLKLKVIKNERENVNETE